jgi:CheY-like chemotaxis protein
MSHEIRTPMNGIIGFVDILATRQVPEDKRKIYLEVIRNSGQQLLSLINDIIDVSKIETNQILVNESTFNVNVLIKNLLLFFTPGTTKKDIQLIFNTSLGDDDCNILLDEIKLNQVLTNLIGNALKFTMKGSIEIGYNLEGEMLKFFVKDTGIGIRKKYQKVIFDRFRQVDNGNTRIYGGAGLGLSISKAFIEMMGGKIWVTSSSGKGTTFYFTVPYRQIRRTETTQRKVITDESLLGQRTILIAEDEKDNFFFLNELLSDFGVKIIHAKNGQQAVEICSKGLQVDLVLMDMKMPVMDGMEATKRIKAMNPSIPIIAMTAYALGGDKERFTGLGCNDYISKPLNREILLESIKKHIYFLH